MTSTVPGISFFDADLKRLPATKSGTVDASNPNDPNKFILNINQSFSSVLNRLFDTSNSDPNNTDSTQSSSDPLSSLTGSTNNSSDPFSALSSSLLSPSLNLGSLTGNSSNPLSQISGLDQQISALQQINSLNQSSALIGKNITYKDATTGEIKSELVKKVVIGQSAVPKIVTASDVELNLSQVIEVSGASVQTNI
jgi:hypothetical protein